MLAEVTKLRREIIRASEEAQGYEVGSEEYLNAQKSIAQMAESANKLRVVDWMALAKDGTMIILFGLLLAFNLDRVIDSKVVSLFRNFFRLA